MKKGYTHIIAIIDRSGSMSHLRNEVIGGFDTFVDDQKKAEGTATMTLIQFDNQYEVDYDFLDIQEVPKIVYSPRGCTAMLDAIGKAINTTGEKLAGMSESERPEKVVVMIQTDGEENASQEYNSVTIKKMITEQESKYDWDFVFLGANMDAVGTAVNLGMKAGNAMNFAANTRGMGSAINSLSKNLTSVRCYSKANMSYETKDFTAQANAGA